MSDLPDDMQALACKDEQDALDDAFSDYDTAQQQADDLWLMWQITKVLEDDACGVPSPGLDCFEAERVSARAKEEYLAALGRIERARQTVEQATRGFLKCATAHEFRGNVYF